MAMTEEQKKKAIALYENSIRASEEGVKQNRAPCNKDDEIQIVARELGVEKSEVGFPPFGERRGFALEENNSVVIPTTNTDKEKTDIGKGSK